MRGRLWVQQKPDVKQVTLVNAHEAACAIKDSVWVLTCLTDREILFKKINEQTELISKAPFMAPFGFQLFGTPGGDFTKLYVI